MADNALRGLVGEVVTRVRGPHEPGEVRVLHHGSYETLIAYSEQAIPRGSAVLVTGRRGAGAVEVLPWTLSSPPDPGALGISGQYAIDEE